MIKKQTITAQVKCYVVFKKQLELPIELPLLSGILYDKKMNTLTFSLENKIDNSVHIYFIQIILAIFYRNIFSCLSSFYQKTNSREMRMFLDENSSVNLIGYFPLFNFCLPKQQIPWRKKSTALLKLLFSVNRHSWNKYFVLFVQSISTKKQTDLRNSL